MSKKIKVLCNTSPVVGLVSIGRLSLLWELFDEVLLPEEVYKELCAGLSTHPTEVNKIQNYVSDGYFTIYKVVHTDLVKSMYGKLHFGELEVIVGAKELGIPLVIIDERAARKMAEEFLIDTIGVLGILLIAKKKGLIYQIKPDIDKLRSNGYRISETLYQQILKKAGE